MKVGEKVQVKVGDNVRVKVGEKVKLKVGENVKLKVREKVKVKVGEKEEEEETLQCTALSLQARIHLSNLRGSKLLIEKQEKDSRKCK